MKGRRTCEAAGPLLLLSGDGRTAAPFTVYASDALSALVRRAAVSFRSVLHQCAILLRRFDGVNGQVILVTYRRRRVVNDG